jgi:predicted RNase H-like HicB family nuclease
MDGGTVDVTYTFRVSLQEEEDGRWSAWIDSLPGCADWGYTKAEALEELQKAAEMFVQSMLEHGDTIPSDDVGSTADVGEGIVEVAI